MAPSTRSTDQTLPEKPPLYDQLDWDDILLGAAYDGDKELAEKAILHGASASVTDAETGMNCIHLAILSNNLVLLTALIEDWNVPLISDRFGRWPTLLACDVEVDEELLIYISEKEAEIPD